MLPLPLASTEFCATCQHCVVIIVLVSPTCVLYVPVADSDPFVWLKVKYDDDEHEELRLPDDSVILLPEQEQTAPETPQTHSGKSSPVKRLKSTGIRGKRQRIRPDRGDSPKVSFELLDQSNVSQFSTAFYPRSHSYTNEWTTNEYTS